MAFGSILPWYAPCSNGDMRACRSFLWVLGLGAAALQCSSRDPSSSGAHVVSTCSGRVPTKHRAEATACSPSADAGADAGASACNTDADCGDAGVTRSVAVLHCLQGQCSTDQCVSDADCPNGGVCSCQGNTRGYAGASPGNACVSANCRTDSDCGPGGYCAPTASTCGPFYGVQGYYCHTCADACVDDTDCAGGVSCFGSPYCVFDPAVGHWACGTSCCAG